MSTPRCRRSDVYAMVRQYLRVARVTDSSFQILLLLGILTATYFNLSAYR